MLQTDRQEVAYSLEFPHSAASTVVSGLEMAVFGHGSARRTQAPAFDLQLQVDTLP